MKKPPELFIRPKGHEVPPVLDKYPTDMTAMQVKSPYHNGERDWAVGHAGHVGHSEAVLHSKKAAEMFKDMANIKTNHDVDVRNKENEDDIPKLKMENPSRMPPPLSNALAGEKLKISFWTFGLTKTQRLGVLRDLVKRTPVVDLGTLPSGYRQLLKDHIKRSKVKSAKRKDASKSSHIDSGQSAKKYMQGGKPQQPSGSPLVTSSDRKELGSDRLIKEKHAKQGHSSWSSSPSSSAASKTHERKENPDQHSDRYNGTSSPGSVTKPHSSKTDHRPSKGHGHRSSGSGAESSHSHRSSGSGAESSHNRSERPYTTEVKSHKDTKRDTDVFKRPQSWDSQRKPDPGPRKAPYITTANTTMVLEPGKYSQSSTSKEHSHPISSKNMQRQSSKGPHWSREHSPASSGSNSYSRPEHSSKERTSSSKDVGSTGSSYKEHTSSSSKSVEALSSSVHKDFKPHSSKGSRDHSQHSSKVSASNYRETGNYPTKRPSKDSHPVRESSSGSKESITHPTKVSSSGSRDSSSGRVVSSSSSSSSNYKNSSSNLKNLSSYSANTSPSKSSHQGSVHSGKNFSSIRKNSSGTPEELLPSRSKSSVQGQRDYHSSSSKHTGSSHSSSSNSSSMDHSKYSSSSARNYRDLPVKSVSSTSTSSSQSSSSSLSSSSSSSHRSGATTKTSSTLSSSHTSSGSDKPKPSPIGSDKSKITPNGGNKPKTTPSGSDKPKIPASQGSTTATELAKQIIQISSKNILMGTEVVKKDASSAQSHASNSAARSASDSVEKHKIHDGDQAELSSHVTGRRHSDGEDRKSRDDSESRGPMQQRRFSSSPISKLVKSDLKARSTQDSNKPVTTFSASDIAKDIIHTHSSRQLAFSSSAEGKKASHISGIKPDFAQSYPPNISSSSSPSSTSSASSPTDRDISLLPTNKTQKNRDAVLHVSSLQGKEGPSHTDSPRRLEAEVKPGSQGPPSPSETSPPSKPRDAPYTTINTDRSFIDAFRGTFRSPSPVPLPVRVKIEALENREQEKSGAKSHTQTTEKEPIVLPSSKKSPLSTVIPSKAPKTQIVEPTMQKVTQEESIINFGMRLPVLVPPKSSDLTQVSIKPNAQVVSMSSLAKTTRPLNGATSVVADKPKTAVVIGSSIPAISATAITADSLQSNEKRVPTGTKELTNEKTLNKDATDDDDEFDETTEDSQDKEEFESQNEGKKQATTPDAGKETGAEDKQETEPENEEEADDKPEEETGTEQEEKVEDEQEPEAEDEPEPEVEDEPEVEVGKKPEGDKDPDYYDVFDFDQHEKQLTAEKATVQSKFVESGDVEFTDNLGNGDKDNETDNELSKMTKGDFDTDDDDDDDGICGDHVVPNAVDLQDRPDSQADSDTTEGTLRKGLFTLIESEHETDIPTRSLQFQCNIFID